MRIRRERGSEEEDGEEGRRVVVRMTERKEGELVRRMEKEREIVRRRMERKEGGGSKEVDGEE